jgi:aryl sulfotransferase
MTPPMTVWLASYPKSGNTWVRAMLAALTSEADDPEVDINDMAGGPMSSARAHIERWTGFASSDLTRDELELVRPRCDAAFDGRLDDVRFRKIHDAFLAPGSGGPIVSVEHTRGAIYVVRDPRDVAVSYAHHNSGTHEWAVAMLSDRAGTMGRFDRLDAQAPQHLGTWSDHVRGWVEHDLFPVHVVRYEGVAADPVGSLRALAAFAAIEPSDERLAAAVASASFEALRTQEAAVGFIERPSRADSFFRRGVAGSWRDELAPELAARVERDHAEVMARMGYA